MDQQRSAARREAANHKQQLVARDELIKKLQDDIEAMTREKAALDRKILSVRSWQALRLQLMPHGRRHLQHSSSTKLNALCVA